MRRAVRAVLETVLLMVLAGALLVGAIAAIRYFFADEKTQCFLIGYYVAVHNSLALWCWKKLRIEKPPADDDAPCSETNDP